MRLIHLFLEHYRNYSNFSTDFDVSQPITVFIGPNGKGKTNILEAMYALSLTKSFRTPRQQDIIQWGEQYARVHGVFNFEDEESEVSNGSTSSLLEREVFIGLPPQPPKVLKENGVKKSTVDFIGHCPMVFFHPEDLNMLYLGPELRRRFLDILGLQINANYYRALKAYQRILEQRNALLKKIQSQQANKESLDVWDEQLSKQGAYLIMERLRMVEFLEQHLTGLYRAISQGKETIQVHYKNSVVSSTTVLLSKDAITLQQSFHEILRQYRFKDIQAGFSTIGPHRDDIIFELNGKLLISHASRGEYRSLFLALKQAELFWYREQGTHIPLLMLDDVFSELDPQRQQYLLESMRGYQGFITTTHIPDLLGNMKEMRSYVLK